MEIICYSCGRGENPENSIVGIEHCQQVNPNWRIEMDVQLTADGHLVLFHDQNTKRITGQSHIISELNLVRVKELNAAYNYQQGGNYVYRDSKIEIPELKEVFIKYPNAKLLIDIHSNELRVSKYLIDLIESDFHKGDFIIVSEYDEILNDLKKMRPSWRFGAAEMEAKKMLYSSFIGLDGLFPIQSDILMLPKRYGRINVLSKRVINHARKRNKEIWAWMYEGDSVRTVNSKRDMDSLRELGIQGVFSEYPERLRRELVN